MGEYEKNLQKVGMWNFVRDRTDFDRLQYGTDWRGKKVEKPDPKHPVTITVWNYYNGAQMQAFEDLVEEFNETEGEKQGIYVDAYSMGNVNELESNVLDAVKRKVGASELPNILQPMPIRLTRLISLATSLTFARICPRKSRAVL